MKIIQMIWYIMINSEESKIKYSLIIRLGFNFYFTWVEES